MQSQKIHFPNADGVSLAGVIDRPVGEPAAWALFAHCFTCSKNLKAARHISRALTDAGIAVLRFDFTGLGQSEGHFADTSFSSNVSDLLAAVDYLAAEHDAPALLLGHSLGGTAVLQAAAGLAAVKAVATIGSPAEPSHVRHMLKGSEAELEEQGEAEVMLGGRNFLLRRQFLEDLETHDLPGSIASLRKPLLVLHAPLDHIVSIDNASTLFIAAKHPKSFVSLDSADHLLSNEDDALYAGRVIASWVSRYLPTRIAEAALDGVDDEIVARTFVGGFRTDVSASGHHFVADEPAAVGGTELGPTPYDLLAAALATCTTMTLRMYANHKKLPLVSATASVRHAKVHATDCADCESADGKIDQFTRTLSFEGDLSETERQKLLEIAEKCPVHRTLHGEIKIRTTLG